MKADQRVRASDMWSFQKLCKHVYFSIQNFKKLQVPAKSHFYILKPEYTFLSEYLKTFILILSIKYSLSLNTQQNVFNSVFELTDCTFS